MHKEAESEASVPTRTQDSMFHGGIQLEQHTHGYRFSLDPVLLAHFASCLRPSPTLDIGTGCGVIPLLMADLWERQNQEFPSFTAMEIQPALHTLAQDNVLANGRSEQIDVVLQDVREIGSDERRQWRIVTCNPPYFALGAGHVSSVGEKALARHEHKGDIAALTTAAAARLHSRGSLVLVYPSDGFPRLQRALQRAQLHITRMQWVHPTVCSPARLLLIVARFRASPLRVEAPLILYKEKTGRDYTESTHALLEGRPLPPFDAL